MRLLFIIVTVYSNFGLTQIIQPFNVRFSASQKGGIRILSNVSVSCNSGGTCTSGTAEIPPNGGSSNGGFTMNYIDIDVNSETFMSSSDSLNLLNSSEVLWAGLYWSGRATSSISNWNKRNQVRIKVGNGTYQSLSADQIVDAQALGTNPSYHCFKDITSLVQSAGIKARFTVANVVTQTGGSNFWGGWSIIVVYKNVFQAMRNLTVFDGFGNISTGSSLDIPISGFATPPSGPVGFELGVIAFEGDRGSTGDQLQFNGAGTFVNVSDAMHNTTDFFNSTISYGAVLTPFRIPSLNNSLGYDASIFLPNNSSFNFIGNNATNATIRVTTSSENILARAFTLAIDILETFDISATNSTICAGQPTTLSVQSIDGLVSTLNCDYATNTGTLTEAAAASSVSSSVPYSGGNGGVYDGQIIASTGVTGLTATLAAGTFANGTGSLIYIISGTPVESGTASFAINIGGQSCVLNTTVTPDLVSQYPAESVFCVGPTAIVDVINPITGETWMDRNLGASQVATSSTDANSYGDLYQWGRRSDGHQCRNSNTTTTLSSSAQPSNSLFILAPNSPNNWLTDVDNTLWNGVSAINNPCPTGYRIPTEAELSSEFTTWTAGNANGAFNSPLKFTVAGARNGATGIIASNAVGAYGFYWSKTIWTNSYARRMDFNIYSNPNVNLDVDRPANGLSVRCIKN